MELSGAPDLGQKLCLPAYHLLHLENINMCKKKSVLLMTRPATFDVVSTTTYSTEGLNFVDCKLVSSWGRSPP